MRATIYFKEIPTRDWGAFEITRYGRLGHPAVDDKIKQGSVYIRFTDDTRQCIADCESRKDAEALVKFLTALINTSEQPPAHT